jgi:hypothetical protein
MYFSLVNLLHNWPRTWLQGILCSCGDWGLGKTSNFSCAESNANELKQRNWLINIRFGIWKVRRLTSGWDYYWSNLIWRIRKACIKHETWFEVKFAFLWYTRTCIYQRSGKFEDVWHLHLTVLTSNNWPLHHCNKFLTVHRAYFVDRINIMAMNPVRSAGEYLLGYPEQGLQ